METEQTRCFVFTYAVYMPYDEEPLHCYNLEASWFYPWQLSGYPLHDKYNESDHELHRIEC